MTKTWMAVLTCMGVFCSSPLAPTGPTREPKDYVLDKFNDNDLVFLGTTHRQPVVLKFLSNLLPSLHHHGVTHLALEIPSDQQGVLNGFLKGEQDLSAIKLQPVLECADYRNLLQTLRDLQPNARPAVRAIDLPPSFFRLDLNRDQWMASRLIDLLQRSDKSKVLVVLGSMHVLRTLPWESRIPASHKSIRATLRQSLPWLKTASIMNIVSSVEKNCDFVRAYAEPGVSVALDLDRRFKGWKLGPLQCMAIRPMPAYELVEGIIVH